MFINTLDKKPRFIKDDNEMIDLTAGIFNTQESTVTCTFYKVKEDMIMRPDLMSIAAYGEDEYTEMIIKYSNIDNPFAIDKEDIVAVPVLNNIYDEVKDVYLENADGKETYDLIKNYHKYIDKSKFPDTNGSNESSVNANKNTSDTLSDTGALTSSTTGLNGNSAGNVEPNLANNGNNGISIINGRIYFGPNVSVNASDVTDVEGDNSAVSDIVDCARNGVTIGQFLNATVKNSLK